MSPPNSQISERFRKQFFPDASSADWNSWRWQLQNRLTSSSTFDRVFKLRSSEKSAMGRIQSTIPISITPYYASVILMAPNHPLRKTVIPTESEFNRHSQESADPLLEEDHSPTKNIIHRYPDRLVFLTTQLCPVYCRYCTRRRLTGKADRKIGLKDWKRGIEYIRSQKNVREVILSGGDPLSLQNDRLEFLLKELRNIPQLELIRISAKTPITLPQRITVRFVKTLRKYSPIYLNLHVIHPDELTIETDKAINMMADNGLALGSQTVLLKGINDRLPVLKKLMERLLCRRIRPYALYQCDLTQGIGHFRTSIQTGLDLIAGLRRCSSGLAVPQYIADPPGGKVSLHPDNIVSKNVEGYVFRNWDEKRVFYPDITFD